MSTTFEDVKVGDRVYDCRMMLHGTVLIVESDRIGVYIDTIGHFTYLKNGNRVVDTVRSLYWDVPTIIAPEKPVQLFNPVKDQPVVVTHIKNPDETWIRYATGNNGDLYIETYDSGRTSITQIAKTTWNRGSYTIKPYEE